MERVEMLYVRRYQRGPACGYMAEFCNKIGTTQTS
jgi:hypothetical protein